MSGRLVQGLVQEEDLTNHVLMHAMGANMAGQLGSVIAGGVLPDIVTSELGELQSPSVLTASDAGRGDAGLRD